MGIFNKSLQVLDAMLDERLNKAKASTTSAPAAYDRKGLIDVEYGQEQQYGWKEKRGLVGPPVLRNMARKNSVVAAIIQTRINQVSQFAQPQKDKYSPGFEIQAIIPADLTREEKLSLADPELEDEEYELLKFELEQKRSKLQEKEEKDKAEIQRFILHCGMDPDEKTDPDTRCDFDKFIKIIVADRLTYNYSATELIPTKSQDKLHHWFPVSGGSIRYVSRRSAEVYKKAIKEALDLRMQRLAKDYPNAAGKESAEYKAAYAKESELPFKYVQVIRGRVEAAWTGNEMIFEAGNPSVDPEDNGYAPGELEHLIPTVTAHLYAEAHNRNYFTQGIGGKGLLHIKGENLSRGQLEGFKRQWFNQLASTRNAFRPPIIGLADEVKWIELAQSNKDMEFDNWMHYLIKIMCAIYQIDPAEINFDITKQQTSTLNEANNEERMKASKDKGLKPLLNYIENIINRNILPKWNKDLAAKYQFKFVGLDAETREQEMKRLETETKVWKTLNEARVEMGRTPLEHGDVVLNATYTQYIQLKEVPEGEEDPNAEEEMPESEEGSAAGDQNLEAELDALEKEVEAQLSDEAKAKEKDAKEAKKSITVEYTDEE